jgi:hypothetical protein
MRDLKTGDGNTSSGTAAKSFLQGLKPAEGALLTWGLEAPTS